jgi:hypothetical protein
VICGVARESGAIAETIFVDSEFCATAPEEFVAVTSARTDIPYRSDVTVKVLRVAPGIAKQLPVGESHFFHWYVKVIGKEPVHVPLETDSVSPMFGAVRPTGSVITG